MKAVIVKARDSFKAGDVVECEASEFAILYADGTAISETEHKAVEAGKVAAQQTVKAREAVIDSAIKASKAFAPKQDTAEFKKRALLIEASEPGGGVDYINSLPSLPGPSEERVVKGGERVEEGNPGIRLTVKAFIKSCEPFEKNQNGGLIRAANGVASKIEQAVALSRARTAIGTELTNMLRAGGDFTVNEDLVKAADFADSTGALGVLNTGLTLMWNLGHLENMLAVLNEITTDISNTPVYFNQQARTRYIKVPGVQLKTATNSWSGTTGNDVDVNVQMSNYAGVPITVNNAVLGATGRQLMNEQKAPQLYGLAEYILYTLINTIANGSSRIANDGTTIATIKFNPAYPLTTTVNGTFGVANATLKTFVSDIPNAMNTAKFPGGDEDPVSDNLQRFAFVHNSLYALLSADSNFMLNQSIWGAVAGNRQQNGNLLETGRFHRVGNVKYYQSQLMSDTNTTTGTGADGGANALFVVPGTPTNGLVGLAGTRNCLLFVSRAPLDYTKVMPEVPNTAAIELVTTPKLGLVFMVVKFLDHAAESANMRAQLMWGTAIGDERQGLPLFNR